MIQNYSTPRKSSITKKQAICSNSLHQTNEAFDFINALAKRCLSKEYNFAPSFLFYETIKGYYFRTIDSMMDRKNPRMVFKEVTPTDDPDNVGLNLTNILEYQVQNSTDTILQARSGMFGSDLLLLDMYNKSYKHFEYDYLEEFENSVHVDEHNAYSSARAQHSQRHQTSTVTKLQSIQSLHYMYRLSKEM